MQTHLMYLMETQIIISLLLTLLFFGLYAFRWYLFCTTTILFGHGICQLCTQCYLCLTMHWVLITGREGHSCN